MANNQRAYFGLGRLASLILAIIPVTAWILGVATRLSRGKLLWGILNIIPGIAQIFWIIDIISMLLFEDLKICA
ncbi:MAG: hypothetical protein LBP26_07265 [Clostridiales bacterium]|nr:hypothetical protein [Clostridiales bacterium]